MVAAAGSVQLAGATSPGFSQTRAYASLRDRARSWYWSSETATNLRRLIQERRPALAVKQSHVQRISSALNEFLGELLGDMRILS